MKSGGKNKICMYYLRKNNLAWLKLPKNACSSWEHALSNDGWTTHDLYEYNGNWNDLSWFGFLRDPIARHVMGLEQFLKINKLYDILEHPTYNKIIISAVFDEHTYSIHQLIPEELIKEVTWFIIDHKIFNYEILVKNFCYQHQITIPAIPRLNVSSTQSTDIKTRIINLQNKNTDIHNKLIKNYLQRDLQLYSKATLEQSKFDIYPPLFD